MSPYISLTLDILMLGVLAATIVYAHRLSRQIKNMRADSKTFEKLIDAINNAASRADAATRSLREAAQQSGDRLQDKINAARGLSDELEIIVQAGDSLAARLETLGRRSSSAAPETAPPESFPLEPVALLPHEKLPKKAAPGQPRTRAEKELLEALRAKQQSS